MLPFELVSLVLLMALVGAMVIARRAVRGDDDATAGPGADGPSLITATTPAGGAGARSAADRSVTP
jgi:hypothetical protein